MFSKPDRPIQSVEQSFDTRLRKVETTVSSIQRDGAKKTQMGARLWIAEIEGDGSQTTWNVPHPFTTRKVLAQVWEQASPYELVTSGLTIKASTEDHIQIVFSAAPDDGKKFNVQIIG